MGEQITVLIVDDEPNNLRALKLDLEDENYDLLTAEDGMQAWEVLDQYKNEINVILLDRMMPNMDGMQFMAKLNSTPDVANIPVIMQTAAAEKEQIIEGIQAGVYHYLTKPYDKSVMLSIVASAIQNHGYHSELREKIHHFKSKLHIIRDCNFEIQTLEDAQYLTTFIANFFPNPDRVALGISELLINAIEHGNLGITYDEKTELNKQGSWQREVDQRLTLPEYKDKKVLVSLSRGDHQIITTITDEGNGFNWKEYLEISPQRATDNHGRGIAMSKMASFDEMEYLGKGNEVVCKVFLSP